jgi:hypothetical protein
MMDTTANPENELQERLIPQGRRLAEGENILRHRPGVTLGVARISFSVQSRVVRPKALLQGFSIGLPSTP